ncbi:acetyl-CoA hydrolase/transferase family protein [Parasphingopyxis lamellibrachiae]|uniref:Acetyl-CoA hydrolase/transferase-like protein n=1 Tax=Parasphingopyxis lamellibrachiae TaxID=680125 RepID=A0A3D9FET7_9SPHN|nr:acetyl-CoA hydrolase/transferase C-terminal domain-containing protein [Parasphingopyxis lamellibrachiae]RED16334.1 acetyl-CoA hydrolase/transferase-like protein [Parasphingopyxis lamellibrachiae]
MGAKQIDAAGARQLLREAETLFLQGMSGEPRSLHAIIADDPSAISRLTILTSFVSGINRFDCALFDNAARVSGFFPAGAKARDTYRQVISTYFGVTESVRAFAADTVFIPVSPPDRSGMVTPGLSAEFVETSLQTASQRIAIISPSLPVLPGNACLSLDRFSHSLVDTTPPLSLPSNNLGGDPVSDAIADHLARLIGDGATLQTGIGRVPSRLFSKLTGHRSLRIHSGLISGEIRTLVEAGAIDPDSPMHCATLTGDTDFYHWLDGREDFRLHPIQHTHHPSTLANIDGLITVNSAIEVDLLGQVNAEKAGDRIVSAAGGLPDFSAAGHRSPGGCSIIALPATDTSGTRSRIVARLPDDAPVTVPRADVDFVVTEHGIAELRGKTPDERARALADIAAPDARPALKRYS